MATDTPKETIPSSIAEATPTVEDELDAFIREKVAEAHKITTSHVMRTAKQIKQAVEDSDTDGTKPIAHLIKIANMKLSPNMVQQAISFALLPCMRLIEETYRRDIFKEKPAESFKISYVNQRTREVASLYLDIVESGHIVNIDWFDAMDDGKRKCIEACSMLANCAMICFNRILKKRHASDIPELADENIVLQMDDDATMYIAGHSRVARRIGLVVSVNKMRDEDFDALITDLRANMERLQKEMDSSNGASASHP